MNPSILELEGKGLHSQFHQKLLATHTAASIPDPEVLFHLARTFHHGIGCSSCIKTAIEQYFQVIAIDFVPLNILKTSYIRILELSSQLEAPDIQRQFFNFAKKDSRLLSDTVFHERKLSPYSHLASQQVLGTFSSLPVHSQLKNMLPIFPEQFTPLAQAYAKVEIDDVIIDDVADDVTLKSDAELQDDLNIYEGNKDFFHFFKVAAELASRQNFNGIFQLARCFANGLGTEKNQRKAVNYFSKLILLEICPVNLLKSSYVQILEISQSSFYNLFEKFFSYAKNDSRLKSDKSFHKKLSKFSINFDVKDLSNHSIFELVKSDFPIFADDWEEKIDDVTDDFLIESILDPSIKTVSEKSIVDLDESSLELVSILNHQYTQFLELEESNTKSVQMIDDYKLIVNTTFDLITASNHVTLSTLVTDFDPKEFVAISCVRIAELSKQDECIENYLLKAIELSYLPAEKLLIQFYASQNCIEKVLNLINSVEPSRQGQLYFDLASSVSDEILKLNIYEKSANLDHPESILFAAKIERDIGNLERCFSYLCRFMNFNISVPSEFDSLIVDVFSHFQSQLTPEQSVFYLNSRRHTEDWDVMEVKPNIFLILAQNIELLQDEGTRKKGFESLVKLAMIPFPAAVFHLGKCHYLGLGTVVDFKQALIFFQNVIDHGCNLAEAASFYSALCLLKLHTNFSDVVIKEITGLFTQAAKKYPQANVFLALFLFRISEISIDNPVTKIVLNLLEEFLANPLVSSNDSSFSCVTVESLSDSDWYELYFALGKCQFIIGQSTNNDCLLTLAEENLGLARDYSFDIHRSEINDLLTNLKNVSNVVQPIEQVTEITVAEPVIESKACCCTLM
ncbi:hypothetical protein RCL1_006780 [Eukaryota sp. TZLM3-RCL]